MKIAIAKINKLSPLGTLEVLLFREVLLISPHFEEHADKSTAVFTHGQNPDLVSAYVPRKNKFYWVNKDSLKVIG